MWDDFWESTDEYLYADELRTFAAENPDGFLLDDTMLHRVRCPTIANGLLAGTLWASWSVATGMLERIAIANRPEITYCAVCDPPSDYFDLSKHRTWEAVPVPSQPLRRNNCRARSRRSVRPSQCG